MANQVAHIRVVPIAFCMMLSACGGGSARLNSTPTPPTLIVTPPPSSSQLKTPVSLLNAPATQEFSTFSVGDSLRIRYDATSDKYEVMAPGKDWDALADDPLSEPGLSLFASVPNLSAGYVSAGARYDHPAPELRYHYSSFLSWSLGATGGTEHMTGTVALGAATPPGGMPVSGSASFQGIIRGSADVVAESGWGNFDRAPIDGSVSLHFDFSQGSLTGQIRPKLACDCVPMKFSTLDFVQTVFASGSPTFSGRFNTEGVGPNSFSGVFTGPRAEELIGKWAFPFLVDRTGHSATGVWIAKRGN